MKLKICGMKQNPVEVAQLHPDYLGFIFWEPSSRHFKGDMPLLPQSIKKVGVFVDASLEEVLAKVNHYGLDAVQLHGKESVEYCGDLRHAELISVSQKDETPNQVRSDELEIIKVFSIKDDFDFSVLKDYESVCDYFLFDTKGKLPGGNGYTFDWSVLEHYPSTKPFFLSGGIGLDSIEKLKEFLNSPASQYCFAIDVNSKFEIEPGLKNIPSLKVFIEILKNNEAYLKKITSIVFEKIENAKSFSDLESIYENLKIPDKYRLNEKKYPQIGFNITKKEINKLGSNFSLTQKITESEHTPLEKLLLAILWKNGDFGKEKHIINGVLDNDSMQKKDSGLVFYQYGKRLNDPDNQPIIDQHILRSYLFHFNPRNEDLKRIKGKTEITKKDYREIEAYISWVTNRASKISGEKKEILFMIDKLLFALGKYIKKKN